MTAADDNKMIIGVCHGCKLYLHENDIVFTRIGDINEYCWHCWKLEKKKKSDDDWRQVNTKRNE